MSMLSNIRILFVLISLFQGNTGINADSPGTQKILILYLSRTKNTKAVAEIIHKKIGGKILALETATAYPDDYKAIVDQVSKENASGYLPKLKTVVDSIRNYDYIFIGFPTWGMQLPPPVKSFLHEYDLSGKTLIPFNTNGGYGVGSSFETINRLAPRSKILRGYSVEGGKERDGILFVIKDQKEKQVAAEVEQWLKAIGMLSSGT